jgi:hypothetical protein
MGDDNPVERGRSSLRKKSPLHVTFVRNENYWQEGLPYLDGIEYVELTDELAQNAALQSDGADYLDVLQTSSVTQILTMTAGDTGVRLVQAPLGCVALMPSSKDETSPLSKLEVRQAISCAIERTLYARHLTESTAPRCSCIRSPLSRSAGLLQLSYDPEKSRTPFQGRLSDGISITFYGRGTDKDAMIAIGKISATSGPMRHAFRNAAAAVDLRTEVGRTVCRTVRLFQISQRPSELHFDPDYQLFSEYWASGRDGAVSYSQIYKRGSGGPGCGTPQMTLENLAVIPVTTRRTIT